MQNEKLVQTLKEIGLEEDEAKVYLSALCIGEGTVLKISRLCGIKRTTIYGIIDSLKEKGLIKINLKGLKKVYVAENPEKLESVLEKRKNEFKNKLPEFMALYKLKTGESVIKYHTGIRAMQNIYMETLGEIKHNEDYLVITNQEKWFNLNPDFAQNYIEKRSKLNIKTRLLFQDSEISREHKKFERNYNQQIKILPQSNPLNVDTILLPSKMIILELTPPYITVVIENKSIIELHREMFEMVWQNL
jgi:HTH-type transcriptional regulator, sugar sensing transcriptional regulator